MVFTSGQDQGSYLLHPYERASILEPGSQSDMLKYNVQLAGLVFLVGQLNYPLFILPCKFQLMAHMHRYVRVLSSYKSKSSIH